jgi:hypothetical protein
MPRVASTQFPYHKYLTPKSFHLISIIGNLKSDVSGFGMCGRVWSASLMAKSLSAGVIPLTTINRSSCLYRSTNFCVASYCTSFRKASCASGISAFWPTGGAPRFCRSAFSCWAQPKSRKLDKTLLPLKSRLVFGAVPSVAAQ